MTRSELKKIIADGESVHLECKLAKNAIPANFWETYSSFANTDGCTILLGERSGMGLSQLYGNWEEAGYARPQLSESFNPERTKVEIEVEEVAEKVAEKQGEVAVKYTEEDTEKSGEVTEKVTEQRGEVTARPNETDERIIALIQSNPHITQKMLSEAIGLTRPYIGRKLLELQVRNIIRRIGPDKGGYWEVLRQVGGGT